MLEGDPSLIMSDFIGPLNVFFCYLMQLLRFLGDTFEEMAERLEGQESGKWLIEVREGQ